jgi:hypothetical protein
MNSFYIAIIATFLGISTLSGCERSPAEQMAIRHSEEQSRINTANYERRAMLREIKEQAEEDAKETKDDE